MIILEGHVEIVTDQEEQNRVNAAYEDKYPGSSAVPIMQAEGPKSATVVITPRG